MYIFEEIFSIIGSLFFRVSEFIQNCRESRAARIRAEQFHKQSRLDEETKKIEIRLETERKNMESKPCMVRSDGQNCTRECVHFFHGHAFKFHDVDGDDIMFDSPPRCKLWK